MTSRKNADKQAIAPVYLVRGDDSSLVAQAAHSLIERLVGNRDASLVVEEHGGGAVDELDVSAVIDAIATPAFLVDRRVVVVRDAGQLTINEAERLVKALANPLESSPLVLVGGGGTIPPSLVKLVSTIGEVVDVALRQSRDRKVWITGHLKESSVRLNPQASNMLANHLGDDLGRLSGILSTLEAAYGSGALLGPKEIEPFLGEAGGVPPWDLTDAIDRGDAPQALSVLGRMTGPGGRPPTVIVGILHTHYSKMLRLDGSDVTSGDDAASLFGQYSAFMWKKALDSSRRMGTQRIAQAMNLVSNADLDIKGATGLPPDLVLEVLIARLSRLVRAKTPVTARHH